MPKCSTNKEIHHLEFLSELVAMDNGVLVIVVAVHFISGEMATKLKTILLNFENKAQKNNFLKNKNSSQNNHHEGGLY